jgi:hypothetical protein
MFWHQQRTALGPPLCTYIFFSEHVLVLASHMPPAFWQSASVFAAVTSPAKAGPVKASARAKANIEMIVGSAGRSLAPFRNPNRNVNFFHERAPAALIDQRK